MTLPNELFTQICHYSDIETLVQLSHTSQALRVIAKAEFKRLVAKNWPWIKDCWSREALRIPQQRRKMTEHKCGDSELSLAELPKENIHTDELVPQHVQLIQGSRIKDGEDLFDVHSGKRFATLPDMNEGHYNSSDKGLTLTETKRSNNRNWQYSVVLGDFFENPVKRSIIGDWLYVFYVTDNCYFVVKHHCHEEREKQSIGPPDYVVKVPLSERGQHEFKIEAIFTSEHVFLLDTPYDLGPQPTHVRLLDMETGTISDFGRDSGLTTVQHRGVDMWLEGSSLIVCYSSVDDLVFTEKDIADDWRHTTVFRDVDEYDSYISMKGYRIHFTTESRRLVDARKQLTYELPYDGRFWVAGILEDELHVWTFPKAEKLTKESEGTAIEEKPEHSQSTKD